MHFDEFIMMKGRNKSIQKVNLFNKSDDYQEDSENTNEDQPKEENLQSTQLQKSDDDNKLLLNMNKKNDSDDKSESDGKQCRIIEEESQCQTIKDEEKNSSDKTKINLPFSSSKFDELNKSCKELVLKAQKDPNSKFIIGKSLIEGINDFPKDTTIGLEYIKQSNSAKILDSQFYYIDMLIKGNVIKQNFDLANKIIIQLLLRTNDSRIYALQGRISKKEKKFKEAIKYFERGVKEGNIECMYKYAMMLFLGEGTLRNEKESFQYLQMSKNYEKSKNFLDGFHIMKRVKRFTESPVETQKIFISNVGKLITDKNKNNLKKIKEIIIQPKNVEKLFYNNSFRSSIFYECLKLFDTIQIDIGYQSEILDQLYNLVTKIQANKCKNIKIGIVFKSFPNPISMNCFASNISYHKIDSMLTEIQENAFIKCSLLTEIIIPYSIKKIRNSAFKNCKSLKKISFPSSVESIGDYAFFDCKSLTQISIPNSVEYIGKYSFFYCEALSKVSMPSSVKFIGDYAFSYCSLQQIFNIPTIKSIGNGIYCHNPLTEISIPPYVTNIGESSFSMCPLTKVFISSSVTKIGNFAFSGCKSLKKIVIPSSVTSLNKSCFEQCISLNEISLPSSISSISESLFKHCTSLAEIIIPSSVTSIGNNAFKNCSSLVQISIPSSVTSIGNYAFENCSSLVQISLPSSVNSFGERIFFGIKSLKIIGDINTIQQELFYENSSLTQIEITSPVTSISKDVFESCTSLTQIIFLLLY